MSTAQIALPARAASAILGSVRPSFEAVYEGHFDFVWRSLRRCGVPAALIDDAVQDVFVVVYRRLDSFEGRSALKSWVFGIAYHVARDYRRRVDRERRFTELPRDLVDPKAEPHEAAVARETGALLDLALDELSDEQRAVFILTELEQMTAPEIAGALEIKLNTVYSRLRAARLVFEEAFQRLSEADHG